MLTRVGCSLAQHSLASEPDLTPTTSTATVAWAFYLPKHPAQEPAWLMGLS